MRILVFCALAIVALPTIVHGQSVDVDDVVESLKIIVDGEWVNEPEDSPPTITPENDSLVFEFTFKMAMNTANNPIITFAYANSNYKQPDESCDGGTTVSTLCNPKHDLNGTIPTSNSTLKSRDCIWSADKKKLSVRYSLSDENKPMYEGLTFLVAGFKTADGDAVQNLNYQLWPNNTSIYIYMDMIKVKNLTMGSNLKSRKPVDNFVKHDDSVVHVIKGTQYLSFDIQYENDMETTSGFEPKLTLTSEPSGVTSILTAGAGSSGKTIGWNGTNDTYTFVYQVARSATPNDLPLTANFEISGAKSSVGDAEGVTKKGKFYIDFFAPQIKGVEPYGVNRPDLQAGDQSYTIRVTFSEKMDTSYIPELTIVGRNGTVIPANTFIQQLGASVWTDDGKTYTASFLVDPHTNDKEQQIHGSAEVTVCGGRDLAGNLVEACYSPVSFDIDQRGMGVHPVMEKTPITMFSLPTTDLTLNFFTEMDTQTTPVIEFELAINKLSSPPSPDFVIGDVLTDAGNGAWIDPNTYKLTYNIAVLKDAKASVKVKISGVKSAKGEEFKSEHQYTNPVFDINFQSPACELIVSPDTVNTSTPTVKFELRYDQVMNNSVSPKLTWDADTNFLSVFTQVGVDEWVSDGTTSTCTKTYSVNDKSSNPFTFEALIWATDGQNTETPPDIQEPSQKENIVIDFLPITANITVTGNPACGDTMFSVKANFNQAMLTDGENILEFIDPDTPTDSIGDLFTFDHIEWSADEDIAEVFYRINTGITANHSGVEVGLLPTVKNKYHRPVTGNLAKPNLFSVSFNPPMLTSELNALSPSCNGDVGSIAFDVKTGKVPITWLVTKDGEAFPRESVTADDTHFLLENQVEGNYVITATSGDGCVTEFNAVLTNPEPIVVAIDTIVFPTRGLNGGGEWNGEILVSTAGGVTPYTYAYEEPTQSFSASQSDSLFKEVATGIYDITVTDANGCSGLLSNVIVEDRRTPTLFTPDGDGLNDVFMEGNKIEIFDRVGSLVYKGDSGWDGKYKGRTAKPAVYFYIVTFDDGSQKKGTIQLWKK